MSKFNYQKQEIFGKYCKILMNANGEKHIFKCIGLLQSNAYMDVPICPYHEMTMHDNIVDVANVIHCGVDESKVIRVAVKDIEIIDDNPPLSFNDLKEGMWVWDNKRKCYEKVYNKQFNRSKKKVLHIIDIGWGTVLFRENRFYRRQKE